MSLLRSRTTPSSIASATKRFLGYERSNPPDAAVRRLHGLQRRSTRIVDYLGSHEHLAVDIDLSVDEGGGLRLRSGAQRFYEDVPSHIVPKRQERRE
jgi:hypothetical protein